MARKSVLFNFSRKIDQIKPETDIWEIIYSRNPQLTPKIKDESEIEEIYNIKEELGRGTFGVVNRAEKDGKEFAVKKMKCIRQQQRQDAEREISILQQLNNENVCKLECAYKNGKHMVLIMEYCNGGELFNKICAESEEVDELKVATFMYQICAAMKYIHSRNVIHLDLKPENVVLSHNLQGLESIKIIDFGGAQYYEEGKVVRSLFGTREYMAPETLSYDPITFNTDMWSVGVLAYNLLSGLSPFLGDNDNETECNIAANEWDFDAEEFDDVSMNGKDFIEKLLVPSSTERLSSEQSLEHPWIARCARPVPPKKPINPPPDPCLKAQDCSLAPPADRFGRRLSVNVIDNLRQLMARRRWKKAGNAMKAMTRISSITRRDIQMMTSPNEDDAKRSKSLSDMPTDMTVDIESLRTPIHDNKKREPEVISSRSAVFQAPRLSVLQNLNKLNNNNNSNTNNNTGFSLRVPQITLNGSKTKSSTRIPSNDSAICEDIPEDRETSPNRSKPANTNSNSNTDSSYIKQTDGKHIEENEIKRSDSEPIQSRRKDSGVSSSDEDKIIFVRRARRRKSVLK